MNIYPFKGLFPKSELIPSAESFFSTTKFQFPHYYENGFFEQDEEQQYYIYQIKNHKSNYTGIVALIDLQDIITRKVIPHEKTLAAKEQEQLNLIVQRNAFIKPILLAYPKNIKSLKEIINRITLTTVGFEIELEKRGLKHKFWGVKDKKTVKLISSIFKEKISKVYVADGHHRCSTATILSKNKSQGNIGNVDRVICTFIPFEEMDIYDYNRVVDITNKTSYPKFIAKLSQYCKIEVKENKFKPEKKHEVSMFMDESWYKLTWKKSVLSQYEDSPHILDHSILNDIVFNAMLEIADVKFDPSIKYVPGTEKFNGIVKKVLSVPQGIGFMLYPVNHEELKYHADNQVSLPPKSTYFEPRMLNGLISQKL